MASITETSPSGPISASTILKTPASSQKNVNSSPSSSSVADSSQVTKPEFAWMVRPCFLYKEEYSDCKSLKARFHQYFVDGKSSDCQHWKQDYDNCVRWEEKKDLHALKQVIESEKLRVRARLRAHYSNNVWEQRTSPPPDWNKELPESIQKEYKNSFLKKKSDELKNGTEKLSSIGAADSDLSRDDDESSCTIM